MHVRLPALLLLLGAGSCAGKDAAVSDLAAPADLAAPQDFAFEWPDIRFVSFDAGPAPVVACGGDAAVRDGAVECAPPPPQCVDGPPYNWLVYYTNGRCVRGRCEWERKFMDCADTDKMRCVSGACEYQLTM